jgi:hypothetical protein
MIKIHNEVVVVTITFLVTEGDMLDWTDEQIEYLVRNGYFETRKPYKPDGTCGESVVLDSSRFPMDVSVISMTEDDLKEI